MLLPLVGSSRPVVEPILSDIRGCLPGAGALADRLAGIVAYDRGGRRTRGFAGEAEQLACSAAWRCRRARSGEPLVPAARDDCRSPPHRGCHESRSASKDGQGQSDYQ
jgi:hypothetical protein